MIVRPFQLSDYAQTHRLLSEVLTEECYKDTIEALARQLSLDSELVLVAEKENELVGIIIGTIDNNMGYYYRIAVGTAHQRKGIGKEMIAALKNRFIERKVRKIMVSVDAHNEPILPLYRSMGYDPADFVAPKLRIMVG